MVWEARYGTRGEWESINGVDCSVSKKKEITEHKVRERAETIQWSGMKLLVEV